MIREAFVEDLSRVGPCAQAFYASSDQLSTFDLGKFSAMWSTLISSGEGSIFLMETEYGIAGGLGALVYRDPYCEDLIAQEFFWFILPASRGGGIGLYKAFEKWAIHKKANHIRMCHLIDSMPAKVANFYERCGFHKAEVHYTKELTCR